MGYMIYCGLRGICDLSGLFHPRILAVGVFTSFLSIFNVIDLLIFGSAVSLLLCGLFSSCGKQGATL